MRIEQLQYLVETAKCESINKASDQLHITQQSLNAALTRLESEMEVTLLSRSSFGVTLTKQGEKAVVYAQEILAKAEEMKRALQEEDASIGQERIKGHLELSAGPLFNHGPLPAVLRQMHQEHKQVRISLVEKENFDMIKSLLNNEARLYLMSVLKNNDREFAMIDLQKLFYQSLGETKIFAAISVNHPLVQQKSITVRSVLKYPLAIFQASEQAPNPILDFLSALGKVRIAIQTNNMTVYKQYIDEGEVVGFSPQFANKQIMRRREGTMLLPIKDFPDAEAVCVADRAYYHKNRQLIDVFLSYLKSSIGHDTEEK